MGTLYMIGVDYEVTNVIYIYIYMYMEACFRFRHRTGRVTLFCFLSLFRSRLISACVSVPVCVIIFFFF